MPATTPTSYAAWTVQYAIAMLAASATFQTLVGAANETEALAFIVNGWGGDPQTAGGQGKTTMADGTVKDRPTSYGLVSPEDPVVRRTGIAFRSSSYSGRIQVFIVAAVQANETAESVTVRGRNLLDAIAADIDAQFGSVGKLLAGDLEVSGPSLPDAVGSKRATFDGQITIDWRDVA
jgi:hypothetical protein